MAILAILRSALVNICLYPVNEVAILCDINFADNPMNLYDAINSNLELLHVANTIFAALHNFLLPRVRDILAQDTLKAASPQGRQGPDAVPSAGLAARNNPTPGLNPEVLDLSQHSSSSGSDAPATTTAPTPLCPLPNPLSRKRHP